MQFKQLTKLLEAITVNKTVTKSPNRHEERRGNWVLKWDLVPRADGTFNGVMFNEKDPTQVPLELKGYKSWQEIRDIMEDDYSQIVDSYITSTTNVNIDFNREFSMQIFHDIPGWAIDIRVIGGTPTLLLSDTEFAGSKRVVDRRSTASKANAKEGGIQHGTNYTVAQFGKTGLERRTRYTLGESGEIPDGKGGMITTYALIKHSRYTGGRTTLRVPVLYTT